MEACMNREMTDDEKLHKQFAVDLFNATWDLLEKPARTKEEDDEMIHSAHASRYHWGKVGEPVNLARGEWQVARVYTLLNRLSRRIIMLCAACKFAKRIISVILILLTLTKR